MQLDGKDIYASGMGWTVRREEILQAPAAAFAGLKRAATRFLWRDAVLRCTTPFLAARSISEWNFEISFTASSDLPALARARIFFYDARTELI